MKPYLVCTLLAVSILSLHGQTEIGYIEKFALAQDREKVLAELIPGSEDYYFFHALHYQNTGQKEKLEGILKQWAARYPSSDRRKILENRKAIIGYETDPEATLAYLKFHLNLRFDDVREVRDKKPDLPDTLDQTQLARGIFEQRALQHPSLEGVSEAGLEILVRNKVPLQVSQRRALLARVTRPDTPGLLSLIIDELKTRESRGFGEYPIHKNLLPEQMAEIAKQIPAVKENAVFVNTSILKLAPNPDVEIQLNKEEHAAWLERLWNYAGTLPQSYNSLKASILYRRLQFDRSNGIYDKARFTEYLKLPRQTVYANPKWTDNRAAGDAFVDLNASYSELLPNFERIGDDTPLVREYLLQILKDEPAWQPWAVWLQESWLKPIFAEAKVLHGVGNPEQWASLLSATQFQALRDRVDVEFPPTNTFLSMPQDDVKIDLLVKNAPKIIVKIYEINALNYFLNNKRQLTTDLSLDGLVANREETREIASANPFLRTRNTFEFSELKGKRGAWVIEFIGAGKSSRALVRKGQWSLLEEAGPGGDVLTVLDEARVPVKNAVAYFEDRKLETNPKTGKLHIPFTNEAKEKSIVLADPNGDFASLARFFHHSEQYKLDAQFHIEREQLLEGKEATLAIRAGLLSNNKQIPIELLTDTNLKLVVTTLEGVSTTLEVPSPALDPKKVFTHDFRVPTRAATVTATLSGKVEKLSDGGNKQDVSASSTIALNGVDRTAVTYDSQLSRFNDDYIFELLGKNGEPIADQQVVFHLYNADFHEPIQVNLRTNAQGRTNLGVLQDIDRITATAPNNRKGDWPLVTIAHTDNPVVHALSGEIVSLPWSGGAGAVSLLEQRQGTYIRPIVDGITFDSGFLNIEKLPPGDYSLVARGSHDLHTKIRVTAGKYVEGWYVGAARELEANGFAPLQIASVANEADSVAIKVANANRFTRVHVAATRFLPISFGTGARSLFDSFSSFTRVTPGTIDAGFLPNIYSAVREIGDEYRYILDRRYARRLPGNMLVRPSLLLNPWEVRLANDQNAQSQVQGGRGGGGGGKLSGSLFGSTVESGGKWPSDPIGGNIDYLEESAPTIYNLAPDQDGVVRVPRASLKDRQYIQVYIEDLDSAAWQTMALAEVPSRFRDLRLLKNLDPAKPFVESKEIVTLKPGGTLKLEDISTADLETYDTLAGVYRLFTALNPNENLAKFDWILRWPELDEKERSAKYSEFACHELNLFLAQKDKAFFEKAILPYLKNKKDKTFIDRYLIGEDLSSYLRPWEYSRLNLVEKCLLARRIQAEAANTSRYLRELWETQTPNPANEDRLFQTALRGGDLAQGSSRSVFEQQKEMVLAEPAAMPVPAPSSAPISPPGEAGAGMGIGGPDKQSRRMRAQMKMEDSDALKKLAMDGEAAREVRKEARPFYRKLGPTKVWAENNYYKLPLASQTAELIPINRFWRDFAAWDGTGLFLSENIAEASGSFAEMMLALSVLDLPFKAESPKTASEGSSFTLTAATPEIAYFQQITPATISKEAGGLMVSQNFFQQDNRYRMEGNERFDRYVTDEFLVRTVYGANIVVTNPTSSPQKVELLLQIPKGAMPVLGSKETASPRVDLQPYTTKTIEYFFYFPSLAKEPGPFPHYPVQVAKGKDVIGSAKPFAFNVVPVLSQIDKTSWDYLSQYGSEADVFDYLDKNNLWRIDLNRVAWRCRQSAEFFHKLIAFMERHHLYSEPIYRYGIFHKDQPVITQWLQRQDGFVAKLGSWLSTKLLSIDPIQRKEYEHLEYWPLINQRALRYGAENRIANPMILRQYQELLEILSYKPSFDAIDHLSVAYYLFLQDRAAEALERLQMVKAESLATQLQLDYFRCYAAFYEGKPEEARKIAAWHADDPVKRWRDKFAEVIAQADEIEGKQVKRADGPDAGREARQEQLASTEPSFEFKTEGPTLSLTWNNLKEVTINYYLLDPEFSFSANPFVAQETGQFSIIKPNKSLVQPLPEGKSSLDIPVPMDLAKSDLLIEVLGGGERKTQGYHANTMRITLAENYGLAEIRELASGKPIPSAYIKVYAKLRNGEIRFYKDGYTDLRGKFDYASLNTEMESGPPPIPFSKGESTLDHPTLTPAEIGSVEKLAILILSEGNGAEVREVAPPSE